MTDDSTPTVNPESSKSQLEKLVDDTTDPQVDYTIVTFFATGIISAPVVLFCISALTEHHFEINFYEANFWASLIGFIVYLAGIAFLGHKLSSKNFNGEWSMFLMLLALTFTLLATSAMKFEWGDSIPGFMVVGGLFAQILLGLVFITSTITLLLTLPIKLAKSSD